MASLLDIFSPGARKEEIPQTETFEQGRDLMQRFFAAEEHARNAGREPEEVVVELASAPAPVTHPRRFAMPFVGDPSRESERRNVSAAQATHADAALAYVDMLTDLPNRRAVEARLNEALAGAKRSDGLVGVVFFDIDGFKDVNDSFGHQAGDAVLVEFAHRLKSAKRSADVVARFGGDEFAAVYPDVASHEELSDAAARIGAIFAEPVQVGSERFSLSASIGIAIYPRDGAESEELIEHADAAMYRAKNEGKAAIRWYSEELGEELRSRRRLLDELSAPDISGQLFLAYQPIVDIGTHEMIAAEALLRWLNPTRGLLKASNVLETAGSVPTAVDSWCVSQAIAHAAEWSRRGYDLKVHVNISNPSDEFMNRVLEHLESAQLPSNLIALEISEAIVLKGTYDLARFASRCREAGIDVLLDRFSGALSLAGLRTIELSAIKLSPEIVAALEGDRNAQSVARAAINIAHTFGWSVVATGVEHAGQQAWLFDAGLRLLQGNGKATPAAHPDFTQWLASSFAPAQPQSPADQ